MLGRLRTVVAVCGAALVLFQGAASGVIGAACLQACEQAKSVPACHKQEDGPKLGCGGSCDYLCAPDKATAMPALALTVSIPTFDVVAVMPAPAPKFAAVAAVEPALYETDSSPPARPVVSCHSLRAPPALGA